MTTESRPHTVADVMALDLVVVRSTAPIEQAAELMDRHHVSGLPVVGPAGTLVGVVSQTDLVRARSTEHLWANWPGLEVRHLMTSPASRSTARRPSPSPPRAWSDSTSIASWSLPRTTIPFRSGSCRRRILSTTSPGRAAPPDSESQMIDSAPLLKVAGEPKELHETRLGAALPVLDMHLYVEEFGRSVVPAYRRGVADLELPADAGLARSIIPPGTAATRDFSRLAPTIPDFLLEKCVGCMACVAPCPDTAILARVIPEPEVSPRVEAFAATDDDPARATSTGLAHFASTTKYGDVPARKGAERGAFGIFVDPVHCKGCGECVEVCAALGHDALIMIDKIEEEPSGESTLERYAP